MGAAKVANFFTSDRYKKNCRARKSPFSQKHRTLMAKYGISEEDYNFMLAFQNNACGICRTPQSELKRAMSVDHCHKTGRIRGLLCSSCNTSIGLLKDSRELMHRASRWVMTDAELEAESGAPN